MSFINLKGIRKTTITEIQNTFSQDHDDWMAEYEKDKSTNNLILISDPKVIKNGMKPNNDSLFDSRFNIPTDVDEKVDEYSCDCKRLIGRYNDGQICPECKTEVTIRYSIELLRRGWIDLGDYKIIVPAMYNKIRSFIGRRKLEEIIRVDNSIEPIKNDPSNPFKNLGMVEFERRFEEVLTFFKHSTTKPELYKIILERKDIVFSSKIYVMSSAHRPGFISSKSKSFNYHNINALFVKILTEYSLIKKGKRTGRKAVELIGNIQDYLMKIHDLAFLKLRGKERIVRSNVISGRLWYSSRMVIVSETEHDIDSTRMSYKGFIGMFELEIMNAMLRGYGDRTFAGMTIAECRIYLTRCKNLNIIDPKIYDICQKLIHNRKDDGLYVIINRNPSFDLGSIQCFRIADIFPNANKQILTIPHNSLVEFNGDFDGDVLNVFSPKERCVVDAFKEGFLPSKLILDRSGDYYNKKMSLVKDEYAFLKSFCDGSFKPIQPDEVKLDSIEDILNKITEPFDFRKIEFVKTVKLLRKSVNDSFFDKTNVLSFDPRFNMMSNGNGVVIDTSTVDVEFVEAVGNYDPFDTNPSNEFIYDPLNVMKNDDYVQCTDLPAVH